MDEVRRWLNSMNLSRYAPAFDENDYNDIAMIKALNRTSVRQMCHVVGCDTMAATVIHHNLGHDTDVKIQRELDLMREVRKWLTSMNLQKYEDSFELNDYNDMQIIRGLEEDQVEEMIKEVRIPKQAADQIRINLGFSSKHFEKAKRKVDPYSASAIDRGYTYSIDENGTITEVTPHGMDLPENGYIKGISPNKIDPYQPVQMPQKKFDPYAFNVSDPVELAPPSMKQVRSWLQAMSLEKYADAFQQHEYDDMEIINGLDSIQVDDMINQVGCDQSAAKLIRFILRRSNPTTVSNHDVSPYAVVDDQDLNEPAIPHLFDPCYMKPTGTSKKKFVPWRNPDDSASKKEFVPWKNPGDSASIVSAIESEAPVELLVTDMMAGWRPKGVNHKLDLSNHFKMQDGSTSVNYAIENVKAGLKTPPVFYVKSTRTGTYHKIEVIRNLKTVSSLDVNRHVHPSISRFTDFNKSGSRINFEEEGGKCYDKAFYGQAIFWFFQHKIYRLHGDHYDNLDLAVRLSGPNWSGFLPFLQKQNLFGRIGENTKWQQISAMYENKRTSDIYDGLKKKELDASPYNVGFNESKRSNAPKQIPGLQKKISAEARYFGLNKQIKLAKQQKYPSSSTWCQTEFNERDSRVFSPLLMKTYPSRNDLLELKKSDLKNKFDLPVGRRNRLWDKIKKLQEKEKGKKNIDENEISKTPLEVTHICVRAQDHHDCALVYCKISGMVWETPKTVVCDESVESWRLDNNSCFQYIGGSPVMIGQYYTCAAWVKWDTNMRRDRSVLSTNENNLISSDKNNKLGFFSLTQNTFYPTGHLLTDGWKLIISIAFGKSQFDRNGVNIFLVGDPLNQPKEVGKLNVVGCGAKFRGVGSKISGPGYIGEFYLWNKYMPANKIHELWKNTKDKYLNEVKKLTCKMCKKEQTCRRFKNNGMGWTCTFCTYENKLGFEHFKDDAGEKFKKINHQLALVKMSKDKAYLGSFVMVSHDYDKPDCKGQAGQILEIKKISQLDLLIIVCANGILIESNEDKIIVLKFAPSYWKIPQLQKLQKQLQAGKWNCDKCTYINKAARPTCEVCGENAPVPQIDQEQKGLQDPFSKDISPIDEDPDLIAYIKPYSEASLWKLKKKTGKDDFQLPPVIVRGMENHVKVLLKLPKYNLPVEWLTQVEGKILIDAYHKSVRGRDIIEEIVKLHMQAQENLERLSCDTCEKPGTEVFLQELPNCAHVYCVPCSRRYVQALIRAQRCHKPTCPDPNCQAPFPVGIIRNVISKGDFDEFLSIGFQNLVNLDKGMVTCPKQGCNEVMGLVTPDPRNVPHPILEKNINNDKILTKEQWLHFKEFRMRCRTCNTIFCASCKSEPYHKGYTCEQFRFHQNAVKCRYCDEELVASECENKICIEKSLNSCTTVHECGHICGGIANEQVHLPCLRDGCRDPLITQSTDDFCNICWIETLDQAPVIMLKCFHAFHASCLLSKIANKWPGKRITFGFLNCPLCSEEMVHEYLDAPKRELKQLQSRIVSRAVNRLKLEGMENDKKLTDPGSPFYQNKELYSVSCFAYYLCFKCNKDYFGGRRNCDQKQEEDRPASDFICFDCGDIKNIKCKRPGHQEFNVWKCRFCCNLAVWFCFGTTHFCDACHRSLTFKAAEVCKGRDSCRLGIDHPPNGNSKDAEYSLGCALCTEEAKNNGADVAVDEKKHDGNMDSNDDSDSSENHA